MPYRDYQAPGVNVIIQRQEKAAPAKLVDFLPVFIGNGMTSRARTVKFEGLVADVTNYPTIQLEWDIENAFNSQLFKETDFAVENITVHNINNPDNPTKTLVATTDYVIESAAKLRSASNTVATTIRILNTTDVTNAHTTYNLDVHIENALEDFDLRLVTSDDSFYAREIFGPFELNEDGNAFYNEVAFAAEIAFRTGVEKFYYLELPRVYGSQATAADFKKALDLIYHRKDAYRLVPLTMDDDIAYEISSFVSSISNPIDKREAVAFVTYDTNKIDDMEDIEELKQKIGGFSEAINNDRVCNVFGAESVELVVGSKRYTLPMHFLTAAVACLDTTVGMAEPLSTREITIFSKFNGPYFRPRVWNSLASYGVFVVHQPEKEGAVEIRHQLTTKQSEAAEYQEYSMIKNFDAVTKRLRDRMKPYAGPLNRTEGFMEKMDGSFTGAVAEVIGLGWAADIITLQPWQLRTVAGAEEGQQDSRSLVGKFQLVPVFPNNNLDIYLII